MKLIIYSDGASRGNPGPSSVGVSICNESSQEIDSVSKKLGIQTNNFAEYSALIAGLEKATEMKATEIEARADSELMIKQLRGEYKVKNANIRPLFLKAKELEKKFSKIIYTHVRREENTRADELANLALDIY